MVVWLELRLAENSRWLGMEESTMPIDGISANQMRFWGLASGLDVDEIVRV